MKWKTIIILSVFLISLNIVIAVEYSESIKTDCRDRNCSLTLNGGARYGYEDSQWKNVEDMRSLANTSIKCSVNFDGTFMADCIDYNATSRTLRLNLSLIDLQKYNKQDLDQLLRVYYPNQTLKQSIANLDWSVSSKILIVVVPAEMSDIIHFGENSTTILLNTTNNGVLGDCVADQATPTTNKGSETDLAVQSYSGANSRGYLSINTSSVISVCPAGSTIDYAEIALDYFYTTDAARRIVLYNTSSFNEAVITWNNQPNKTGNILYNTSGGTGWKYYNATALFAGNYLNGVVYGVLYDDTEENPAQKDNAFYTKEYATVESRWYVTVNCTQLQSINVTNPTTASPMTVNSGDVKTIDFLFNGFTYLVKVLNISVNTTNVVPLNVMRECNGTASACSSFGTSDTCGKAGCTWNSSVSSSSTQSVTTGWTYPTANNFWVNSSNVTKDDGFYARGFIANVTNYVNFTSLSIPAGAQVTGIQIWENAWASATTSVNGVTYYLSNDSGTTFGQSRDTGDLGTGTTLTQTLGGQNDKWGLEWTNTTAKNIVVKMVSNASGARFMSVDIFNVTIYYNVTSTNCYGTANACYLYNTATCNVNDSACSLINSTQMWNGTRWITNITMPTMGNGSVNLFMKANYTSSGTIANDTEIGAFTYGTLGDPCVCPSVNTNWAIPLTSSCLINTDCNLGAGNISFTGTGYVKLNATVTARKMDLPIANQIIWVLMNAWVKLTG